MELEQRDEDLERTLATLDEDLQAELFDLVSNELFPHPQGTLPAQKLGAEGLKRIEQQTFAKLGLHALDAMPSGAPETVPNELESESDMDLVSQSLPESDRKGQPQTPCPLGRTGSRRYRRLIAYGAVAASVVVGVLAVAPGPVSAALQKLFDYVPGIGIAQSASEATGAAVLEQSVQGTWYGMPVTVMGIMVSPTEILVRMNGSGTMSAPKQVSFVTPDGKVYALSSYLAGGAGGTSTSKAQWSGDYSTNGNFGPTGSILSGTIVLGPGTTTKIPVQLHVAQGVSEMSKLGPTDSHQGITIAAVPSKTGSAVQVLLAYQYKGPYHIWDFMPAVTSDHPGILIQDSSGHKYTPKQVMSMGPDNQFSFTPQKGQTDFQLTLPQVDATYPGQAKVTLPIPAKGTMKILNQTVDLGGFPVTFTKVEQVTNQQSQPELRAYLDLHASTTGAKALHIFHVGTSWSGRINPTTGAIEWVQVGIHPGQRSLTLHLNDPEVYLRGPWVFHIHVPDSGQ